MSRITIYHNPACGTSRNTLAMEEPKVIEYLQQPPTRDTLLTLIAAMGGTVRDLLREKGTPYQALDLGATHWTNDQLLDFIGQHPVLMNRPIVVTPLGTRLCRPSERVLEILPSPQSSEFTKEDGERIQRT